MKDDIKILVVDDNPHILDLIRKLLADKSFLFFEASDGSQGLEMIAAHHPDLVLLDVMMPDLDGFEVCRRIKTNPHTRGIMVVMISAVKTDGENQAGGLENGADGYITLPISNRELLARLRSYFRLIQKEKLLKEREAGLKDLFTYMINAFVIFTPVFDDHGHFISYRFVYINPAYERITGVRYEDVKGKTVHEVWPETEDSWVKAYGKVALTGESATFEMYHQPTGKLYNCNAYCPGKDRQKFCVIFEDITERKLNEEVLRKSEARLQELNATKDKFFSIIAHDLKNPFNAILGFSSLLLEQIIEKDYDGIEKYAATIKKSSQRVMNLLTNLLDWSRSQTGKMDFNPGYFEISKIIHENIKLLQDITAQKSIEIISEIQRKTLVFADQDMLGAILRNLLSNAVKFTKPGGKIIISLEEKEDDFIFSVKDHGVGIKKADMEKLFRIDKSYSTRGTNNEQGSGLGLILCKEFIEKHGGHIEVESEEGKGSTFRFNIPKS